MKQSPANQRVESLESLHRDLDARVKRLERRAYLTPPEQQEVARLKREKLSTKDRLTALRRG